MVAVMCAMARPALGRVVDCFARTPFTVQINPLVQSVTRSHFF